MVIRSLGLVLKVIGWHLKMLGREIICLNFHLRKSSLA